MEGLQWFKSPVTKNKVFDPTKSKQYKANPPGKREPTQFNPLRRTRDISPALLRDFRWQMCKKAILGLGVQGVDTWRRRKELKGRPATWDRPPHLNHIHSRWTSPSGVYVPCHAHCCKAERRHYFMRSYKSFLRWVLLSLLINGRHKAFRKLLASKQQIWNLNQYVW